MKGYPGRDVGMRRGMGGWMAVAVLSSVSLSLTLPTFPLFLSLLQGDSVPAVQEGRLVGGTAAVLSSVSAPPDHPDARG